MPGGQNVSSVPEEKSPPLHRSSEALLPQPPPGAGLAEAPPHGAELQPNDAHELLAEKVLFNPNPIPSSNTAIAPDTPLEIGQHLQVKWGDQWWAGRVLGLEPDGKVRIHYFGWADSWDEAKPRTELQWDRKAPVRALESTYVRKGW